MTCILAVEHEGAVYMGGDSARLAGWGIEFSQKVFIRDDFIFGCSGFTRFAQLIEFNLVLPERVDGESDMQHIVRRLVPAIRECAKSNGYTTIENGVESARDDLLLVGYRGKIYKINGNLFSVNLASRGYAAIGCGEDFALGAYSILQKSISDIEKRIVGAIAVAREFSVGVLPPYYVLKK